MFNKFNRFSKFPSSTASITAWLALGNDPILTTLADGTRELVNSKGDNVLSTTGIELTFDGVADGIFVDDVVDANQLQSTRVSWDNAVTTGFHALAGAGYNTGSPNGFLTVSHVQATNNIRVSIRLETLAGPYETYNLYSVSSLTTKGTAIATLDANSGEMKLYINGQLDNSVVHTGIAEIPVNLPASYPFAVGVMQNTTAPTNFFKGDLSNVQFIKGIVTESQVLIDYNNPESSLNRMLDGLNRLYNNYLEDITAPIYDSGDTSHLLITDANGAWTSANLNNTTYKHFFITPSATPYSVITLTTSGTEDSPRTIQLYDNSNAHPSKLIDAEQANIDLLFQADYWHISRVSTIDNTNDNMFKFDYGATNNIVHRCHFKNYFQGIASRNGANFNTVQLSYFNHMTHDGRMSDNVALLLTTNGEENVVIEGTKYIANDIRNAGDGIQLVRSSAVETGSYPDTIIDSNKIWMDGDVRTNGDYATNGYNPLGEYQIGEEAMDFKIGSDDPLKPVVVTNNIMHGYRSGDGTAGGSQSTGAGTCVVVHYNVRNVIFERNIMYDAEHGLAMSGLDTGLVLHPCAGKNWSIKHNIFANLGLVNPTDRSQYMNIIYNSENIAFDENIFYNCQRNSLDEGYFIRFEDMKGDATTNSFKRNVCIDAHGTSQWYNHDDPALNDGVSLVDIDNNYFYASTQVLGGTNDHTYTTVAEANMLATSFDTQALALGSSFSLVGTASTETSPHIIGGHTLRDLSQDTGALILAVPMTRGELEPRMFKDGVVSDLVPEVSMATNWVSGQSEGLQKIYFNSDMTKANTMHISTDYNQIIAVVPTEAYTVKWTTSNNTIYELSTFTTNIDTNQMLAHMGVSDAEIKSIEII